MGKQKRLGSVRLPLIIVFSAILAYIEEKYPVPGFHVDFAQKKDITQLSGLITGDGLRGLMERIKYSAAEMVLPFFASFIRRNFGFVER